jgi:hypothetical protein
LLWMGDFIHLLWGLVDINFLCLGGIDR